MSDDDSDVSCVSDTGSSDYSSNSFHQLYYKADIYSDQVAPEGKEVIYPFIFYFVNIIPLFQSTFSSPKILNTGMNLTNFNLIYRS